MFSNRDLRNLIFPLFGEQFLLMLVGIADTFTVSFASEADVSGESLVNSFNTVLVFVFTALSSGGAVIISQYVGRGDGRRAERSAGQLRMLSVLISAALTAVILAFHSQLLILLFGRVEAQVMAASRSYLLITTCSIPALAVYDVGAALCRSIGKAGATMYISTAANLVNIIGNCVGVFVLHLGRRGWHGRRCWSRMLSAAAVSLRTHQGNAVRYRFPDIFSWDGSLLKKIMGVALPNGLENGVHQLVKVGLSSMVARLAPIRSRPTAWPRASGPWRPSWGWPWHRPILPSSAGAWVLGRLTAPTTISESSIGSPWSSLWLGMLVFAMTPIIVRYSAISAPAKELVICWSYQQRFQ